MKTAQPVRRITAILVQAGEEWQLLVLSVSTAIETGLLRAGSKIRVTSMISMAVELVAVLLGYKVFRRWTIKSEAEA